MRGRPAGQMTHRRQQVLECYQEAAAHGVPISLSRMARETGLYDYRKARRVLGDLRRMGALA